MLQLYDLSHVKLHGLTNYKELKRECTLDGEEVLSFSYPQNDDKYQDIKEETYIRTKDNEYVIKEVNIEDDWTEFVAKINVESLKGTPFSHFESVESNCSNAVNLALTGTGWTIGSCDVTKLRTTRKSNCSSYDILQEIRKVYRCDFRFDAINKKVYIYQSMGSDKGAYFSEELNLKKLGVQSNSYDYCTRIIPIGKDGLRINDVNGGKEYVENYQYSTKVITIYWEDNRYTVAQSLKDDSEARLNELSKPIKAYKADIYDFARLNDKYKNILDYDLGDTITLLSKDKKVKDKQRIVKIIEYPDEAERNSCEIANRTLSLEDMQADTLDAAETVATVTTSDGMIDNSKVDFNPLRLEVTTLIAQKADITDLNAATARIGTLESTKANITDLTASTARITTLETNSATITQLNAATGRITTLESKAASIDTLLAGNLSATNMQAGFITATSGLIANGAISDAMIANLSVSKVLAGDISTNKFRIVSDSGKMLISDNTIQIKDASRVRVQIGKDANNDYNMYVWDSSGNLMFDATGLKANGIKDKIIRDDMVSDTANINGSKIEKESLVTQINGATTLLKATKIKLDTENQTLDVAFTSLKSTVTSQGNTVSSQGTAISTIQGQISSKIWSSDITTAVNAIQIGGRNLLTAIDLNDSVLSSGNIQTYQYTAPKTWYLFSNKTFEPGDYVYSIYMKKNAGDILGAIRFYKNDVSISYYGRVQSIDGDWNRFIIKFTVTSKTDTYGSQVYNHNFTAEYTSPIYVKKLKIESGNKASDWTEAPEDTDAQITTISNNYSSLNQTVNSISANVSSLQTTTSDLGTRMTNAESQLSIQAGQITSKVSQTDINNSINAIQIGTRNLFLNSASERLTTRFLAIKVWDIFTGNVGKQVAISFDLKCSIARQIQVYPYQNNGISIADTKTFTVSATGVYQRFSFITTVKDWGDNGTYSDGEIGFYDFTGTQSYSIKNIKIEWGNKATDWTSAPEDVQGQIDTTNSNLNSVTTRVTNAESNINQLSNSISLKVSTTDFTSYKTSNDSAVSSLTSRISAAELKITSDAIVSTVRTSSSYINDLTAKANVTDVNSQITQLSSSISSKVSIADFGTYITQNVSSVKIAVGQIGGNNLIKNGGFEFGTTGWGINNNPSVLTDQTWQIYQGKTCFIGTNDTNGSGIYQSFPTIVGKKYTVQFVLLVDGYHNVDGTVGIEGVWSVSPKDVMSWTKYTYTFTATNTAHVFIAYANAGGSFYIDNIQLEEGENATAWSPNSNEINNVSVDVSDSGLTVRNGSISILNNIGTQVLKGDTSGNLVMRGTFTTYDDKTGNMAIQLDKTKMYFYDYDSNNLCGIVFAGSVTNNTSIKGMTFGAKAGKYLDVSYESSTNIYTPCIRIDNGAFGHAGKVDIYSGGSAAFESLYVSGSKNCIQETDTYGKRLINAYETAEYYFGDLGSGKINGDGECIIYIEDIFQECVNTNIEYHVFSQVYKGSIEKIERFPNYFIVYGDIGTEFTWEIKAKRKGYEHIRLEEKQLRNGQVQSLEDELGKRLNSDVDEELFKDSLADELLEV